MVAHGNRYTLLQSTSSCWSILSNDFCVIGNVTNCVNSFWYAIFQVIQGFSLFISFHVSSEILSGLAQTILFQFLGTVCIRPSQLNTCELLSHISEWLTRLINYIFNCQNTFISKIRTVKGFTIKHNQSIIPGYFMTNFRSI